MRRALLILGLLPFCASLYGQGGGNPVLLCSGGWCPPFTVTGNNAVLTGTLQTTALGVNTAAGAVSTVTIPDTGSFNFASFGGIAAVSNGILKLGANGFSPGADLDVSTDATVKFRNRGNSADATISAGLANFSNTVTVAQGTIATDVQGLAVTTTASSSSLAFTQSKYTMVDTASAAGSKFFEYFGGAAGTTSEASLRKDGLLTLANTINVASGGSTTISTGVGSVKMSTANPATNTAWIPISYAGTTYYVPAFATNAP